MAASATNPAEQEQITRPQERQTPGDINQSTPVYKGTTADRRNKDQHSMLSMAVS